MCIRDSYYPEDMIQYWIGGAGEFQDWDGNPVYLYEDALVEARKVRSIRTDNGAETVVTDVREKMVRVQQPDVPVLDWNYMGGGEYDVTVMYLSLIHISCVSRSPTRWPSLPCSAFWLRAKT